MNEAPLAESLGILARTASEQLGAGVRAAFYLANPEGTALHHVIGMTPAYAEAVDGFHIGPESLACGLAVHTGQPILTADVNEEPRWAQWRWLAEEAGFRACWSFPIHTTARNFVGTLAIYWPQPREATSTHCEHATLLTQAAGIIIARQMDVEVRKRAVKALRESEARFRMLADNMGQLAWTCDELGSVTWYNKRWLEYTGLSFDQMAGWGWTECVHPEHLDRVVAGLTKSQTTGEIWEDTFPLRGEDGPYRWFLSSAYPIRNKDGRVTRWFGTNTDITERKQAEDMLRQRSERMELLSDTLAQLLGARDPDPVVRDLFSRVAGHLGVDTYFNYMVDETDTCLRLHSCAGVSQDVARSIQRLEFGEAICGTVAQTRAPIHAIDVQRSDYDKAALVRSLGIQCYACQPLLVGDRLLGTLSFASHTRRAFDQDDLQFLRIVSQYTAVAIDRLQRAQQLREREQQLTAIFSQANAGFGHTDLTGRFLSVNDHYCEMVGRTREELLCKSIREITHPEDLTLALPLFQGAVDEGLPFEIEQRFIRSDGSVVWVNNSVTALRDTEGRPQSFLAVAIDLTERKRAEETQQLLLNELNHRVKNTLAIVQAIAKRTLARTRNPEKFAESFGGRIQSLARVHTLLSAASWDGADLRELIRDQLLAGPVDENRLRASGPAVSLDPQTALHLALMLHELGTNSSKYGAFSSARGYVTIDWRADDALHIKWVERGGPRMSALSRRGFGITLIEQSAKSQGGDAQVLCEDAGITWQISLPLRDHTTFSIAPGTVSFTGSTPLTHNAIQKLPCVSGYRFLVVEDEPLIGLDIVAALEDQKAQVEGPIGTVEQACKVIEQTRFDGALLDASLHGQPVHEVATALTRRNVPFLFVTGHGPDSLPEAFRGVAILSKPCSHRQVVDAAAQLVATRPEVAA